MAPRKVLRLAGCGSKLTAVDEEETQPKAEPKKEIKSERESRGSKDEAMETSANSGRFQFEAIDMVENNLNNLSLETRRGPQTRFESHTNDDEEVFIPDTEFLEADPNARIVDVESSPPRGTPAEQFEQFSNVMKAAQVDVTNQALEAVGSIARNLREVEGRSLRCLEREIQLRRRESEIREREAKVVEKEKELLARKRDMPVSWNSWGKGRGRVEKRSRWSRPATPPSPNRDQDFYPRNQMLLPLQNKKGKRSLMFVDDISKPLDVDGFIREITPSSVPWLRGRKFGHQQMSAAHSRDPDYTRVPYNYREGGNRMSRGLVKGSKRVAGADADDWRNLPNGRGPGGSKKKPRRRSRSRGPRRGDGGCNADKISERRRRDDDEDPPEVARNTRARCHSNVYIRQNVNVK